MADEQEIIDAPQVDTPPDNGDGQPNGNGQPKPTPQQPLAEEHRKKLDAIVGQMILNKESEDNIKAVVNDFKQKYANVTPVPEHQIVHTDEHNLDFIGSAANQRLTDVLGQHGDPAIDDLMGEKHRMDIATSMQPTVQKQDATFISKALPDVRFKEQKEADRQTFKTELQNDPNLIKPVLNKIAEKNPDLAPQIKSDRYKTQAVSRGTNVATIAANANAIEKGDLDYNLNKDQLQKPIGFWDSMVMGHKQRNQSLDDYHYLTSHGEQDNINYLESRRNQKQNPDVPVPTPTSVGKIGSSVGSEGQATGTSILAALGTSAIGLPEVAPYVAATVSSPEYFQRGFANSSFYHYNDLRNAGMNPQDAYRKSADMAKNDAAIDVAQNAVANVLGAKVGGEPINLTPETRSLVGNFLKKTGAFAKESAGAGGVNVGSGVLAQVAKNINAGKPASEGIEDGAFDNFAFPFVLGGFMKGAHTVFGAAAKPILAALKKVPPEVINEQLQNMKQDGTATDQDINDVKNTINSTNSNDAKIPVHVTDPEVRQKVSDLMDSYDEEKKKLDIAHDINKPTIKARMDEIKNKANELMGTEPQDNIRTKKIDFDKVAVAKNILNEDIEKQNGDWTKNDINIAGAKGNPEEFLKFIATQAHGITENGESLEGGGRENDMQKPESGGYSPELINAAKEAYPKESFQNKEVEGAGSDNPKTIIKKEAAPSSPEPDYLLSRHADTVKDEQGKVSGPNQSGLSGNGKRDANDLANDALAHSKETGVPVKKVIHSDLERAMETGDKVADKTGAVSISDKNLRTWDIGDFDDTKDTEFKKVQNWFAEHPDEKTYNGDIEKFQGKKLGESLNEYAKRTIEAHKPYENEPASTMLIDHSNNMMIMDAYRKNGNVWDENAIKDYINAEKPEPATLVNKKYDDIVNNLKSEQNAIPIKSTNALDVQPEAQNGEGVGGGNTKPENTTGETIKGQQPPPIEKGGQNQGEEDPEMTKMANAINDAHIEGKFGTDALDKVINELQDTHVKDIYNKVKERIEKGLIDLDKLRERLITTRQGNEADQAALLYDLAKLKGQESDLIKHINETDDEKEKTALQSQLMDVQNKMMDNALANRVIGRTASNVFRLRQLWANREMNLVDMQEQYKASKGLSDLTDAQKKEIAGKYKEIQDLRQKVVDTKADLDKALEENAKLKAENDKLKELKDKSTAEKKADRALKSDEAIAKSNERIKKAKDNLKSISSELSASVLPFNPKIAIEIGKIAAEKFYQGIVKFDELVKNVYDEIKDALPHFTEQDVANHILTTKDKDGNLQPSLVAERYAKSKQLLDRSNKSLREKVAAHEAAQKEVALKQFEWQKERRMDMMDKRPLRERIVDSILRWQRFAVLSYPSTIVKLAAVVAHQLTLKPLKFLIQKFVAAPISKGLKIENKQGIWGDPKWSSLSKYYSAFIRNFALSNLKEQFKGIDTKELLYGNSMNYDEWAASKGLLEMPGRTHGYIKSFIKNPEFQFAHEQLMNYHISEMADIQKKLENTDLKPAEKEKLQDEYNKHDVTNEDVMEQLNKQSLDHARWGIMMNDNKFVQKLQQFEAGSGIGGALIKSELPIIKIPVNYVSRAFATKYGFIKAITGSKWYGGNTPSVMKIIFKGSKEVTPEQADLLGKTLSLGTMGAAFFGLGYMIHHKVKENDDGSVDIAGVHLSKNLVHSPELDSFFSGATTANQFDKAKQHESKTKAWIESYLSSDLDIAKKAPFTSMMQYGFLPNVAGALLSKKNNDTKTQKVEDAVFKKISDMTIPGFVKQPAGWLDTKQGGLNPTGVPIKRTPQGDEIERFWQTMELGIPGLRQNVPESKTKSKSQYTYGQPQ